VKCLKRIITTLNFKWEIRTIYETNNYYYIELMIDFIYIYIYIYILLHFSEQGKYNITIPYISIWNIILQQSIHYDILSLVKPFGYKYHVIIT